MVIGDVLLCISSGLALVKFEPAPTWSYCTFTVLFLHGCSGVMVRCTEQSGTPDIIVEIFNITTTLCDIIPLPFMNTYFYLTDKDVRSEIAYIHAASTILPLVSDLILDDNNASLKLKNLVLIGNIVSLTMLAVQKDNKYYYAIALTSALHWFAREEMGNMLRVSTCNILSLGLAVFCYLSSNAIKPD